MSFEQYDSVCESAVMSKECKPDYEKQASDVKTKLDATTKFKNGMYDYMNTNRIGRLSNISSFAELLGGICIIEREQTESYKSLLDRIEKD